MPIQFGAETSITECLEAVATSIKWKRPTGLHDYGMALSVAKQLLVGGAFGEGVQVDYAPGKILDHHIDTIFGKLGCFNQRVFRGLDDNANRTDARLRINPVSHF